MKSIWINAVTSLSALMVLAACGGSASVADTSEVRQDSASVIVVADDTPARIVEPAREVKIGSAVGERVPNFEVTFLDGTSVSSAQLAAEGRPAFLFFMATW